MSKLKRRNKYIYAKNLNKIQAIKMREDYEWFIKADFSKYAGKWIATIGKKVVVEGDDAEAVYKEAKNKYPGKKPSLAKIPTGDTLIL